MANKFQSVRGFNDVLPADAAAWQFVQNSAAEVFAAYGYGEIRLPLLEHTGLFKRAIGEVTDVVEKEMFTFDDREGQSLSLRPEATASCVRAGLEHGLLHNQQQRLWYAGPMFRHERPQAGRYRQFHQIGAEAYGMPGPYVDVEVIALSARLFRKLGLKDLTLEINSLGTSESRKRFREELMAYFQRYESSLDADSKRRLYSNPMRILDSKVPTTQEIAVNAPIITDHLDLECAAHFAGLQEGLTKLGINYVVNPRIVRGLDYYSRTVFEWTTQQLGTQGTVCAGGRYDGLVEQLGGSPAPAVGWASGIERLILLLKEQGVGLPDSAPHACLCWEGEEGRKGALILAEELRDKLPKLRLIANGGMGKLAAQIKRADKAGIQIALILSEDQAAAKMIQVKSLFPPHQQTTCGWPELSGTLSGLLNLQ